MNTSTCTSVQQQNTIQTTAIDWLLRNDPETNRDKEIPSRHITINAIETCTDITGFITAKEKGKHHRR